MYNILDFLHHSGLLGLAVSLCGLIFGLRALSRHGKAAMLTSIGWGLVMLERCLFFLYYYFFFEYVNDTLVIVARLGFLMLGAASLFCVLLGIYMLLSPGTRRPEAYGRHGNSGSAFQYQGLDLHAEGDRV
tara:strand:+ start:90 stop:482 length:393 start_codon:yes stop_codon:yes gene_type:complete